MKSNTTTKIHTCKICDKQYQLVCDAQSLAGYMTYYKADTCCLECVAMELVPEILEAVSAFGLDVRYEISAEPLIEAPDFEESFNQMLNNNGITNNNEGEANGN